MQTELGMTRWGYAGLGMLTLATLMFEILLTRIFSVTMYYHFAFLAISLAMFGMTVGALWVYLNRGPSTPAQAKFEMARSSLFFALSAVAGIVIHSFVPFISGASIKAVASMATTYLAISVPFFFSGIAVCLALTKFPLQVSKLYAADLAGAASGCVLLIYALKLTDGPTAVVLVAFLASASAVLFARDGNFKPFYRMARAASLLLAGLVSINTILVHQERPLLRLKWTKGRLESRPVYEKWNSFSRIAVSFDPNRQEKPFGWGLSPAYSSDRKLTQLFLHIDANAETVLTLFYGDMSGLDHLKFDVTNLVHYIRPDSSVLVIGAGGGRDVLSALKFKQKSVLAVEINEDIIGAVNKRFGYFTGRLDRNPRVTFVNDEARSYITRSRGQFDIIQVSLIDTWAATAAGAFVLTENSIYTLEAWKVFLEHLTPRGVLTISRWYLRDVPGEIYRTTSLASASLMQLGVNDPQKHIVVIRCMKPPDVEGVGVGTILVSREPFSDQDLDTLESLARRMRFDVVLSPRSSPDPTFARLASGIELERFAASFPLDISPPTDDRPFFFHMLRLRDAAKPVFWKQAEHSHNVNPVLVLGVILIVVTVLTLLCIIVPLALTTRRATLQGALPHFIFFGSIGAGFMLVEISQMQRLIIFLGHPIYGLSVVLFGLLIASGLGSYSTTRVGKPPRLGPAIARLLALLLTLTIFGILTPRAIGAFQASTTPIRIVAATGILFPLGLVMGTAFPLGLKLASSYSESLTPWLWGINGATSVCASVLAVAIAMNAGISTAFWTGSACYAMACVAFVWMSRRMPRKPGVSLEGCRVD